MFSHTTCPETIGKSRPHAIKARVAGKTFLQILFFFLLVTQIGFAQWYQQNTGTTQNLYAVHFTDANNGFAVGDSGTIIQTNDGGATWANQTSGTILMLRDIFFVSSRNGWAVGYDLDYHSVVLHTTNGGIVWKTQWEQQNVWLLESVFFVDSLTGWIVGDSLVGIYEVKSSSWKTSDGGFNWLRQYEGELHTKMTSVFFIDSLNGWAGGIAYSSGVQPPLLKTTNSGVNWNYMTNVPQYTDAYSIHFTNINNGWIVGEPNVTQTTDGGDSWIKNDSILGMRGGDISVYFTDLHNGWS